MFTEDPNSQPPTPACPNAAQRWDTSTPKWRQARFARGGIDAPDADSLLRLPRVQDVLEAREKLLPNPIRQISQG
ncbi:MAG: hypothetical protein ACRD2A_13790 [Vicinamibacterales bacterium]